MEKKYISIGNEKIAYLDEGKGDVVLLIHGNMSSSIHYEPLISQIKDEFRCIAPDLRGFGDSSYNNRFDSLEELADDLKALLDKLKITSAYVVGWSTGGGIGLKIAAKYPDLVKKYFSIEGAGIKGYPIYVNDNFKALEDEYHKVLEIASKYVESNPVSDE